MESIKEVKEMEIDVRGDIIGNDDKWIYDWLEWDSTCPDDVKSALQTMPAGEKLIVNINSGGGSVMAGQEIYSLLHGRKDVEIHIQSLAGSAASVIAMAGTKVLMSPVSMLMIHNPATIAFGDKAEMQKAIHMLAEVKESIMNAYEIKTGLNRAKLSSMMDAETWMNAHKAVSYTHLTLPTTPYV